MKKLLISILIILLIVLAYFSIFEGLAFGSIQILSVEQIMEENDKLTSDIEQTNALLKKEYPSKQTELDDTMENLLAKKEEYFKLARVSTEGEITQANTEETYLPEYLWVRVGNHAKSKGVNIRMDVNSANAADKSIKNIAFTVNGQYGGIINFIASLENDDKLNFRIENFKMIKGDTLTATFNVRNVRVKVEEVVTTQDNDTQTDDTNQGQNS